jgi:hypothetical protein
LNYITNKCDIYIRRVVNVITNTERRNPNKPNCRILVNGGVELEIGANITFICEYDGVYTYWVQYGDTGKMVQLTEEDLKEEDP